MTRSAVAAVFLGTPHRFPMLMLDRIEEISPDTGRAVKALSGNEVHAEGGIGDRESAEDVAHLDTRQAKVGADLGLQHTNADPVEIGDRGQRHGECDDAIANCELHATLTTNWETRRTKPPESSLIPVIRLFFYLASSRSIVDLPWKI